MHARSTRSRTWTLLAVLLVAGALLVRVATATPGHRDEHARAGAQSAAAARGQATRPVRVGAASAQVPRSWRRIESARDHATWVAPDRSASVTLGVVASAPRPLGEVVRSGLAELGRQLPGIRAVRVGGSSTQPRVRFRVARASGTVEAVQVWRRAPGSVAVDAIATWTWAPGARPRATPAPTF